ncbi:MAG: ParB family protein [Gammaproteobacteria bacterium]
MKKQRPSDAELIDLLQQPHFRRDQGEVMPSTDPINPTPMILEVDQIRTYDRNPRRVPNSMFEAIKDSIRASGMTQTLNITRRPDAEHYMVAEGGNTRLKAVQELWQETGDERFHRVHCLFQPWAGDTETLVAHLKENDLRGDLTFIDRALAIRELRQLLEDEGGGERLTPRQLAERLKRYGYSVGRTILMWFDYAVDTLHPAIPTALRTGMGRPQIERIRNLDRAFCAAWAVLGLGEAESAQSLFIDVLSRHDGETLDLDPVRRDLETELSVSADCDVQRASLVLGAALSGRTVAQLLEEQSGSGQADEEGAEPAGAEAPEQGSPVQDPGSAAPASAPASTPVMTASPRAEPEAPNPAPAGGHTPEREPTQRTPRLAVVPPAESAGAPPPRESETPVGRSTPDLPTDLKSLRARCWTLATRLAHLTRMGDVVIPIPAGLGYLVSPVPQEVLEPMAPEAVRTAAVVWWHLAALAEQFAAHGGAISHMPEEWCERPIGEAIQAAGGDSGPSLWSQWYWGRFDEQLATDVPPLDGPDIGPAMYQAWGDREWSVWTDLVETYRAVHRLTSGNPWR